MSDTVTLASPSLAGDLSITPQARKVLAYLTKGKSITPMKALVELSIPRLASCIHEIKRRAGYAVGHEDDRDESGHKFRRYWLQGNTVA